MKLLNDLELTSKLPSGWMYAASKKSIEKEFKCENFLSAVAFIGKIATEAEAMDHHPDIFLHSYNKVFVTLSTHSAGGVTELDLTLATKIDSLH
ncbi:MAG TPA: 4a-hydroxytetrahydrobiopterin dehydratase [Candidatus Kapabacteria bacterium]|nr:4a-hydroxytetrahydrobiopterin dehydratase [Candidatus Kapabacteria bacterium]